MTHQSTSPTPAAPDRGNVPTPGPMSLLEIQLEGCLVARCGVDAMLRRAVLDRDHARRVDWGLPDLNVPAKWRRRQERTRRK